MTAAGSYPWVPPASDRDEVFGQFVDTLRQPSAPQWMGRVVCGVLGAHADTLSGRPTRATIPVRYREAARLLSLECAKQDKALEQVRTGRLIRVVIETPRGAAYCFPIVPNEHVVAFLVNDVRPETPHAVVAADDVVIQLSTEMRRQRGMPDLDAGGRSSAASTVVPAKDGVPAVTGRAESPLYAAAARALDAATLQWVAHVRGWSIEFTADHFEHERAAPHFGLMSPDERRWFYANVASTVDDVVCTLSRHVLPVVGGPALRVSLDVEEGVIVAHRLGAREYLVGVTLEQKRVAEVEDILAGLAAQHIRG